MKSTLAFLFVLLMAVASAFGATENFTTWTETDGGSYLDVSASSVVATNVPRNVACYVSKDFGAGYFEDFEVRLQFTGGTCSHQDYSSFLGILSLGNSVTDWYNLESEAAIGLKWSRGSGGYYLALTHEPTNTNTWNTEDEGDVSPGTEYFITITRDYDGGANGTGQYTMTVCTTAFYGEAGATLVQSETLDSPAGEQAAFRYAMVAQSRTNGSSSITASGTITNLEFVSASTDPPAKAASPNPADALTGVLLSQTLSWAVADGAENYDLYFGLAVNDINDLYVGNFTDRSYDPNLSYETDYHWRVDANNAYGTTTGDVWTFSTVSEVNDVSRLENFETNWTEVDSGSDIAITDANTITVTDLPASLTSYVYRDMGPEYFGGDWLMRVRTTVTAASNLSYLGLLALANATTDYQNMIWASDDGVLVYWRNISGQQRIYLTCLDDGSPVSDYGVVSLSTEYWLTLARDNDAGANNAGLLTLYICTGAHYGTGGTVVDTLTVNVPSLEDNAYRYALTAQSMTNQGASSLCSGTISHLDLGIPTESGPPGEPNTPDDDPNETGVPGVHGPYYVSPLGDDDANGCSPLTPWKTILYALDNAVLHATESYNVIYLMAGDHGSISITSKTWDSSSWSNEWRIQGLDGATLTSLVIQGLATAYLDFNDVDVTWVGPHYQYACLVNIDNVSHLKFRGGTVTGYWDSSDSYFTTGKSFYIEAQGGGYCEDITIDGVTTVNSWDSISLEGNLRDDIVVKNCDIRNNNQSAIYCLWADGVRDAYDQVELLYNTNTQPAWPKVSSSTTGAPHSTSLQIRGNNLKIVGHRATGFGGSGGIRFYESYGPYDNMTVEDCVIYNAGEVSTLLGAFQCGTNVRIVNNTFVSTCTPPTSDNYSMDAYRYTGAVMIGIVSGADVEFANNIVVGSVQTSSTAIAATTGGNNLIWSLLYDGAWRATWDTNDIIVCTAVDNQITTGYTRESFETAGEVFIGGPTFASYFDSTAAPKSDWSVFALPATSVAVDGGRPSFGTATDVLGKTRTDPDIGAFEYIAEAAPDKARGPTPADGATGVALGTLLQWQGSATDWNVYIGTSPSSLFAMGNQQAPFYEYSLGYSTTYYWRVDANNAYGTATGDVWSFTTTSGLPGQATNPQPVNGADNQPTTVTLRWSAASGATAYNVYLGTESYELLVSTTGLTATTGTLAANTTYYWRVDTVGLTGTTEGQAWSFTTYDPAQGGEPGTPTTPMLPAPESVSVRSPMERSARPDHTARRYLRSQETLQAFEAGYPGTPGSYALEEYASGYVQRIVVVAAGSDTDWSLTVTDSWGAPILSATGLSMLDGVLVYDVDNLPFADGLIITIADTENETVDGIYMRFYVREVVTGY